MKTRTQELERVSLLCVKHGLESHLFVKFIALSLPTPVSANVCVALKQAFQSSVARQRGNNNRNCLIFFFWLFNYELFLLGTTLQCELQKKHCKEGQQQNHDKWLVHRTSSKLTLATALLSVLYSRCIQRRPPECLAFHSQCISLISYI